MYIYIYTYTKMGLGLCPSTNWCRNSSTVTPQYECPPGEKPAEYHRDWMGIKFMEI